MTVTPGTEQAAPWRVTSAGPSIIEERALESDAEVSRFGDEQWSLAPLGHPPSSPPGIINWARFPNPIRESFRRAGWLLINTPTPSFLLEQQGSNRIEWYSGSSIRYIALWWLKFAEWLGDNGIHQLCDVSRGDLEDYAKYVQTLSCTPRSKTMMLTALTRLWAHAPSLPPADQLRMPPWEEESIKDFLPTATGRSQNKTPIVHPSTMAPLLLWAQRMLDLSIDIDVAHHRWLSLLDATPKSDSLTSRRKADQLVSEWISEGRRTLPMSAATKKIDLQYLAAMRGGINTNDLSLAIRASGASFVVDEAADCPIDTPITATIDGKPWCNAIDRKDLLELRHAVSGAALVILGYLTGMRPHEVLALRPGCSDVERLSLSKLRYTVRGRAYKRVRKNGRADPEGKERGWTTIAPVARAINMMEKSFPDSEFLFHTSRDPKIALRPHTATERIEALIQTANRLCDRLSLPDGYRIPPDPDGLVSLSRFRRTLAWHIRRLPHGKVALAIQYGHLTISQGEGYAGLNTAGFASLMEEEEVSALRDNLAQVRSDLDSGSGASGPAARRLIQQVTQGTHFAGSYLTTRELTHIASELDFKLYDNPQNYLACLFDPNKALCHSRQPSGRIQEPRLGKCRRECPNIVRTDRHIAELQTHLNQLTAESRSPLTPIPIALRLRTRTELLANVIAEHRANAIHPQPNDPMEVSAS